MTELSATTAGAPRAPPRDSGGGGGGVNVGSWAIGLAAAWWIAGVVVFALSLFGALLQPRHQRRRASSAAVPPVTLICPVKAINPGFERAGASAFTQDLPESEVLVGAAEERSPAVDIMARLVGASPVPARILRSPGIGATSPKLDTLATPLEAAAYDVVATKDSNISLSPDSVRVMLRSLVPGVGLVCGVPVAVRAEGLGGRVEAILINRDARLLLTASAFGKGYGVGKVMLFRRSDLARAGGVAALAYTIAEDTALSRALGRIGLRTAFAENTVDQEIGARKLTEVFARQARWAVIRRAEEPVTFALEPLACPLPAAVAGALAAPLLGLGAATGFVATLAGWYAVEVAVTALKRWELHPWTPTAFLGRDGVLLLAWARAWFTRSVVWHGDRQDVRDVLKGGSDPGQRGSTHPAG